MSIIKILPDNLISQIAAGEVVERPASVVKELVENSLDAGATSVLVEVREGGKSLVRVADNGHGMTREECVLALKRHATSKIQSENDLWSIRTMGFRGEAMASISSVSKMKLKSRQAGSNVGTEIFCDGGEVVTISDVGMDVGSKIEVADLFFNTPARQKYLKKDSTELSHITSALNNIALAHPDVAFKLVHNDRNILDLPVVTDLISRITDIFGKDTANAMVPVYFGGSDLKIDGFVGKPLLSRTTTKHQYFFVNGRPIQHHLLANRIKAAFHSMLMENKKPIFIINIDIAPGLVDVNVHPRKLEVRFEDQQSIVKSLYGAVKTALEKNDLMPKGYTESRRYMSDAFPRRDGTEEAEGTPGLASGVVGSAILRSGARSTSGYSKYPSYQVQEAMDFSEQILRPDDREQAPIQVRKIEIQLKAIEQVANSYIIAKNEEGLVLVDQHAAHEKVRFETLMSQFANQEKSVQQLLVPLQIELSGDEAIILNENMEVFDNLGFEIEHFGGNTFIIHTVPAMFAKEAVDDVVKGVLDDISMDQSPSKFQGNSEKIVTSMSCRSAVMFGQALSLEEMQGLLDQLATLEKPYTCPHGRPTMVALTFSELEKMFGRK